MNVFLIVFAVIIFICVLLNNVSGKLGVPVLLAFMLLGILIGWNKEIVPVSDYWIVERVCTVALIFIMFYGGFGTRWASARPVAVEAGLLATLGVAMTAGITGAFCHFALGWKWVEGLLMGSVISSTDAASVFSILRSRKLGLKNNTAPMLEVESGSNDPMSYMLTAVMLSAMKGTATGGQVAWLIGSQLIIGAAGGMLIAQLALLAMRNIRLEAAGFDSLFIFSVAILSYALPAALSGNGYLSTYIVGIVLGNTAFSSKRALVGFFDGVTSLMQILIFFLLGLMANVHDLHRAILPALAITACLMILARPASVFAILGFTGKYPIKQRKLISFVGLRGAASIVFAIMIVTGGVSPEHDIFNIVFCIVLISISVQGTLIPAVAKKLDMIDDSDVMTTFSDFSEDADVTFGSVEVDADSPWKGRLVSELGLPSNILVVMILRGEEYLVPMGHTLIHEGDTVITCTKLYDNETVANLVEHPLSKNSKWIGHPIKDYPKKSDSLVVMIRRGSESLIPNGNTVLEAGDVLFLLKR